MARAAASCAFFSNSSRRAARARDWSASFARSDSFACNVSLSTAIAANGKREAIVPVPAGPLAPDLLDKMNRYWRAANYLCIGQIYLFENPLLREPLKP